MQRKPWSTEAGDAYHRVRQPIGSYYTSRLILNGFIGPGEKA